LLIGAVFLIVATASLFYVVLYSTQFHLFVKNKIIAEAQELTGGRVTLRDFNFNYRNLQADFYELTIHGTEKDPTTPFFFTKRLTVKLKIISVFKRTIDLRELAFDRPSIYVWVDSEGRNNFPERRVKAEATRTDLFDLAVKTFIVSGGALNYNDQHIPLQFALNNLETRITFDASQTQYVGQLAYSNSQLRLPPRGALPHDLSARFEVGRRGARLSDVTVTTGRSRLSAIATLTNYQQPVIDADYKADLDLASLRGLLPDAQLPTGDVVLTGSVHYDDARPGPAINRLNLKGNLISQQLHLSAPEFKTTVHHLRGDYLLAKGDLRLDHIAATVLGGSVQGHLLARSLLEVPEFHAQVALRSLALQQIKQAVNAGIEHVHIAGTVSGRSTVAWRGALEHLLITSDLTIKASASPQKISNPQYAIRNPQSPVVPIEGTIHSRYDGAREVLSFERSYVRTPHTELRLGGSIGRQARLDFSVRSDDVRELDLLAADFLKAQGGKAGAPALPVGVTGAAEFSGALSGSLKNPHVAGRLAARALQLRGTQWKSIQADLEYDKTMVAIRRAQLNNAGGRIDLDLWAALHNGSFTEYSPIRVQAALRQVQIADLQRLAALQYPVSGVLSADVRMTGSKARPVGNGTVQLANARAWEEPIDSLSAQFQATGDEARVSNLRLTAAAGTVTGDLRYEFKTEGYEARLQAPQINLARIEILRARAIPVSGILSLSAAGRGTVKDPQLQATVHAPSLTVQQEQFKNVNAEATVAHQLANFKVQSDVTGAYLNAVGQVVLDREYYLTSHVTLRNAVLETLLAAYLPDKAPPVRGQFEATADIRGSLKQPTGLQADAEIPKLSLRYQNIDIANTEPLRFHYRNQALTIEQAALAGADTQVRLSGTVPLTEAQSMRVTTAGTVNLKLLRIIDRDLISEGQAQLNLTALGSITQPRVEGNLAIRNGVLSHHDLPVTLSEVNGDAVFNGTRVDVSRFTAQAGGGELQVTGFAVYNNKNVQYDLKATGRQVRVRYPEGVRILLDSDLAFQGTSRFARLNGQVLINRISLTNNFDLANLLNQFSSPSIPPPPDAFTRRVRFDVGIRSTEELSFGASKFNLQGLVNLRLRGTAADPGLTGRINATNGELYFASNRYRISRGVIEFVNPVRIDPVLNVAATTTVDRYEITINFNGPFDKLRTRYISDPPLPPVDVINLLAFGKPTEQQTGATTTARPPQLGAASILAQALSSTVSSRAEKLFGITRLQIDPLLGGSGRNPTARLGIQQRVSKDLTFTFATGISSTQQELIQIEYQINKRFSVTALRDENGSMAFDVKFKKVF
jgi:translocation and assembly module TamB